MQMNSLWERCFSLTGKTALITGASGGIGRTLAVALAEAGAAVGIHGRNRERTEETCRAVEEAGGRAAPLISDIETIEQCRSLVTEAHAALGQLDILINCAATNRRKPMLEATQEDFDAIVAINLRAPYFLSQATHPYMVAQGGGKIIHIGSINSFYGLDNVSIYGLSKGGLAQLTKVMAVEWARDNI
ncbi:MAG: SDR family NAD(P)-dependent oxidoreductase, partial [Caldilinea sp.]